MNDSPSTKPKARRGSGKGAPGGKAKTQGGGYRAFPDAEYQQRQRQVRKAMQARGLDGVLVSSPENIFYLTGLDYQGYFAYQLLILPLEGAPVLITRAVERALVKDKVPDVTHIVYSDGIDPLPSATTEDVDLVMAGGQDHGEVFGLRPWSASLGIPTREVDLHPSPFAPAARATVDALTKAGLGTTRLGLEKVSAFLPIGVAEVIMRDLPQARFEDASDLVTDCRIVQSPLELAYTRKAAVVSESMMLAAIAAAGPGVEKRDVLAAIYQTMFLRGGTYPGFVPLVRSTRTLEHEHGPWEGDRLAKKDLLFIEMSGCVQRYHAPLSRLIYIGKAPRQAEKIRGVCEEALELAQKAIRPGVTASEVYQAWQGRIDAAGLHGYTRHHCGYLVGIGFPPSWTGSGVPVGLRQGSSMELKPGMVFHLMSWLLRTGMGDHVISDTVVVTESGCEVLTNVFRALCVR